MIVSYIYEPEGKIYHNHTDRQTDRLEEILKTEKKILPSGCCVKIKNMELGQMSISH